MYAIELVSQGYAIYNSSIIISFSLYSEEVMLSGSATNAGAPPVPPDRLSFAATKVKFCDGIEVCTCLPGKATASPARRKNVRENFIFIIIVEVVEVDDNLRS